MSTQATIKRPISLEIALENGWHIQLTREDAKATNLSVVVYHVLPANVVGTAVIEIADLDKLTGRAV